MMTCMVVHTPEVAPWDHWNPPRNYSGPHSGMWMTIQVTNYYLTPKVHKLNRKFTLTCSCKKKTNLFFVLYKSVPHYPFL